MNKLNVPLLLATILTVLAFFAHTFGGDMELQMIQPESVNNSLVEKQQIWTMVRCGWHWISFDLFFASVGLILVNFTGFFVNKKTVLQIMSFYFFGYAIVWILILLISQPFSYNFLKLGQWILLLTISGLIYYGNKRLTGVTGSK
jgi:hypothetical protein